MIIETGVCREQKEKFGTRRARHRNKIEGFRAAGVPTYLFQRGQQKAHRNGNRNKAKKLT